MENEQTNKNSSHSIKGLGRLFCWGGLTERKLTECLTVCHKDVAGVRPMPRRTSILLPGLDEGQRRQTGPPLVSDQLPWLLPHKGLGPGRWPGQAAGEGEAAVPPRKEGEGSPSVAQSVSGQKPWVLQSGHCWWPRWRRRRRRDEGLRVSWTSLASHSQEWWRVSRSCCGRWRQWLKGLFSWQPRHCDSLSPASCIGFSGMVHFTSLHQWSRSCECWQNCLMTQAFPVTGTCAEFRVLQGLRDQVTNLPLS